MSPRHHLGDLHLTIMRILWAEGEATASHVHATLLEERGLALTTIKTMLRKMDEKGVVGHRTDGRTFIYRATIEESDVREGMVGDLVQRLFSGDGAELVHHLIDAGEIDAAELDGLRERLAKKKASS